MLNHVPILLAEDDQNDIELMRRAFGAAAIPNPLLVVENGKEAVEYLGGKGMFQDRKKHPVPGLVLLDLKLPWMDGFDVLIWLRRQQQFQTLPVVVLTSSKLQSDIDRSRLLGVYDYRVKPNGFQHLVVLLKDITDRWLDERFNTFTPLIEAQSAQSHI